MKLRREWMVAAALVAFVALLFFFGGGREFMTAGFPTDKFQIQFAGNKCAAPKGGAAVDFTPIEMVPCSDSDPNQQWTYDAAVKRIRWAKQPNMLLDVSSYANLTPVVLYTDKNNNQQWTYTDGNIANVGRPDVVLDVRDGQTILQVYQKVANAPNQKFTLKSLTPPPAPVTAPQSMPPPPPANPMVPAPPPPSVDSVTMGGTPAPVPAAPSSAQPVIVLPESAGPGTFLLQPTS